MDLRLALSDPPWKEGSRRRPGRRVRHSGVRAGRVEGCRVSQYARSRTCRGGRLWDGRRVL